MVDLQEKMESLVSMKPELVADGLDEIQLESAKKSYEKQKTLLHSTSSYLP